MVLYTLMLTPANVGSKAGGQDLSTALRKVGNDLRRVMGSLDFLKTMFCIGVPAKAILTGTITFALPLLLGQAGYSVEEIGQIIMLYGLGVVAASGHIARLVDRMGQTETVLFGGVILSGLGLSMVGLLGPNLFLHGSLQTTAVVAGVVIIGIAHGFINAPVVTHVAHSPLASQIGANPATTAYRFLERTGHIAGPFLVGQAFLIWGQTPTIVTWIGLLTVALGLLFFISSARSNVDAMERKPVS
jgi:predicted MFS family arabinose efflux permease